MQLLDNKELLSGGAVLVNHCLEIRQNGLALWQVGFRWDRMKDFLLIDNRSYEAEVDRKSCSLSIFTCCYSDQGGMVGVVGLREVSRREWLNLRFSLACRISYCIG